MAYTIGVDAGGTNIRGVVADRQGAVVQSIKRPTDPDRPSPGVHALVGQLLAESPGTVEAIGLAVAAWVEHPSGKLAFAPNLTVDDALMGRAIAEHFGMPVAVENDANAAAWAEHRLGAGRQARDMVMVTVGTGVGGGAIVGGRLYRGSRGFGGEFGHMPISVGGPECSCGSPGCLEAWASGTALGRLAEQTEKGRPGSLVLELASGDPAGITGAMVGEAAIAGDRFAIDLLEELGTRLGVGLAALAKAFDPQVMVVGGGVADVGEMLVGPARAEVQRRYWGQVPPPMVVAAKLGNDAGVVGAALLAWAVAETGDKDG
ncbi:MAG: ROK family protein [Actinomycetota bacterium]